MSDHTHTTYVPGCYRCDLSRDEVAADTRTPTAEPTANFTKAKVGDTAYVYVDVDTLSEHYCVFDLKWFEYTDGQPINLRRQVWQLVSDEPFVFGDPEVESDDD